MRSSVVCIHTHPHARSPCSHPVSPRPGQAHSYMTQPRAQISDLQECPLRDTTSGAWKFGVPQSTLGGEPWEVQEGGDFLAPLGTTRTSHPYLWQ